jgi:hypothetical protein
MEHEKISVDVSTSAKNTAGVQRHCLFFGSCEKRAEIKAKRVSQTESKKVCSLFCSAQIKKATS